jgi:uncharacterized protein (UPF0332 family)
MKPRDFLEVADALSMANKEADWRTAVSRAYYAAFHVAWRLLQGPGFQIPRADQAHAYLWRRLSNCGHIDVENAGKDLSDLRRVRNWADYDLDSPLEQTAAMHHYLVADRIIGLLETVATSAAAKSIIETMKTYERDILHEVTWHP